MRRSRTSWSGFASTTKGSSRSCAAASRALTRLGLPEDEIAVSEYLTLFELIAARAIDAAAIYLRNHLTALAEKNLARLKIVAVIGEAQVGVSYLTPRESD